MFSLRMLMENHREDQWKDEQKDAQDGATRQKVKRRFMDALREDVQIVGGRTEDAEDQERWRRMIRFADSWMNQGKAESGRTNAFLIYIIWGHVDCVIV